MCDSDEDFGLDAFVVEIENRMEKTNNTIQNCNFLLMDFDDSVIMKVIEFLVLGNKKICKRFSNLQSVLLRKIALNSLFDTHLPLEIGM